MDVPRFTAAELIACADREVRLRRRVYPRWVEENRLSEERAEDEIAKMQAILDLLRDAEAKLSAHVKQPPQRVLL
jgi:hypothetical protein